MANSRSSASSSLKQASALISDALADMGIRAREYGKQAECRIQSGVRSPRSYVIQIGDAKFDSSILQFLDATGLESKRTSSRSPWQKGIA